MIKNVMSIRDPMLTHVQNKMIKNENKNIGYKDYSNCYCLLKCLQGSVFLYFFYKKWVNWANTFDLRYVLTIRMA